MCKNWNFYIMFFPGPPLKGHLKGHMIAVTEEGTHSLKMPSPSCTFRRALCLQINETECSML